jgi:hypothetical protein
VEAREILSFEDDMTEAREEIVTRPEELAA